MKAILATVTVVISLIGTRLTAADATPTTIPVEQQFQQADVQLAIEQYKKLRMAAFDLDLKLQIETVQSDEQRQQLQVVRAQLLERAQELRAKTIGIAAAAVANTR
jgi:nucleoid-associated protein YgaU